MFLHVYGILFRGGLCPSMHHRSHDWGVSVQGVLVGGWVGLCPGGYLSMVGSLSRGISVRETPPCILVPNKVTNPTVGFDKCCDTIK